MIRRRSPALRRDQAAISLSVRPQPVHSLVCESIAQILMHGDSTDQSFRGPRACASGSHSVHHRPCVKVAGHIKVAP
jgi:hypothetical protein